MAKNENEILDISTMGVKETTTIQIEDANGNPIFGPSGDQVSITVYGPGSAQFKRAQAARNRRIVEHIRKGGKKMRDEESYELDAEFLATCTHSFNGLGYKGLTGYEMFKACYLDNRIGYIAEQVNKEIGEWGNFT